METAKIKESVQSFLARVVAVVAKPAAKVVRFAKETFQKVKDLILES